MRRWCAALALGAACASSSGVARAAPAPEPGFKILSAGSALVDGVHRLDARISFDFSEEVLDAMRNGVAVTVSVEMEVLREGRAWDRRVARVLARYRIQLHTLSRQYLLRDLSTGETATFRTVDDLLRRLGRVEGFPMLDDGVLEDSARYLARVRANLEIESLPTPLRVLAYFSPRWRLSSEWKSWPLQR